MLIEINRNRITSQLEDIHIAFRNKQRHRFFAFLVNLGHELALEKIVSALIGSAEIKVPLSVPLGGGNFGPTNTASVSW